MLAEACARSTADYRSTHRGQLVDVSEAVPRSTDAPLEWSLDCFGGILLPVSRKLSSDLPGLRLAVELAISHQCQLVVICSQDACVLDFPDIFGDKLGNLLVLIDLADVHPAWLPRLESAADPLSNLERFNDVGPKRNIGLALAVYLGWQYVLFMDDDIDEADGGATLDAAYLSHAVAVMQQDSRLMAVGWTLEDYDDNSVVGHARPLAGMAQGIFIGAGALLVRCTARLPFFPDIYNEDWLFLIALAASGPDPRRALGWCGRVRQRRYEPFQAKRARSEEVGEIVGEGLMNLFEDHGAAYFERAMSPGYWRRTLQGRWQLLESIKVQVRLRLPVHGVLGAEEGCQRLIESMTAAQTIHRRLNPMDFVSYLRAWRNDETTWRSHLLQLALLAPTRSLAMAAQPLRLDAGPADQGRIAVSARSQPA